MGLCTLKGSYHGTGYILPHVCKTCRKENIMSYNVFFIKAHMQ